MTQGTEAAGARTGAGGFFHAFVGRLVQVMPGEAPVLGWAWLYIFSVLSSYYIMRPIRDQMGVAGGVNNLQWLFTGTLIGMLLLNIPYAYLVKTLPRTRFIAVTYRFFAANILLFALALHFADAGETVWIGRAFFIWISIFNLFVVSVFWALIVDTFNSEQGKRLFGFIAAGATIGAITRFKHHSHLRPSCADTLVARWGDRAARNSSLQRAASVAAVGSNQRAPA